LSISLLDEELYGIKRCPQCGIAHPLIRLLGPITFHYVTEQYYPHRAYYYFTGRCSHCGHVILFNGYQNADGNGREQKPEHLQIERSYPDLDSAAEELPEKAQKFLQQALESRHAPDGALMLAASAIDAMLKDKGYRDGTLFARIGKSSEDGVLTEQMAKWAHAIRLSANEPRHADDEFDGATQDDADQILAFTKALGEYLYVLPAKVERWKNKAGDEEDV